MHRRPCGSADHCVIDDRTHDQIQQWMNQLLAALQNLNETLADIAACIMDK